MSSNLTKILIAAAAGFAAGAALGILFAPDKGSETRKKVKKSLEDASGNLGDLLEPIRDAFRKESTAGTAPPVTEPSKSSQR